MMQTDGFSINKLLGAHSRSVISKLMFVKKKNSSSMEKNNEICMRLNLTEWINI